MPDPTVVTNGDGSFTLTYSTLAHHEFTVDHDPNFQVQAKGGFGVLSMKAQFNSQYSFGLYGVYDDGAKVMWAISNPN